jgi:hypothetical protein
MKKNVKMILFLNFVLILLISWSSVGNSETRIIDQYTTHRENDLEMKTTALYW